MSEAWLCGTGTRDMEPGPTKKGALTHHCPVGAAVVSLRCRVRALSEGAAASAEASGPCRRSCDLLP